MSHPRDSRTVPPPAAAEGPTPLWDISARARPWVVLLATVLCGVLLGLATPRWQMPLAWPVALVPLFVALHLIARHGAARARSRWLHALGCCWLVGLLLALLSGDWVVNTAHVYGALPLPLAHGVNVLGFGTLNGLEIFVFLGLPFMLGWRRPWWGLLLVVCWAAVLQVQAPRFFYWTYGQLMYPVAPLIQVVDLVGSAGLNALLLPLHLVLFAWLRELYAPGLASRKALLAATAVVALLFGAAYGYGQWRMAALARAEAAGAPVDVVGIQPNFTLRHLASNPALSHSDRKASLQALLADSEAALALLPPAPGVPRVVVWPESVYPAPYLFAPRMRATVEAWVRAQGVHLVLTTLDYDFAPGATRPRAAYGASLHITPAGRLAGRYRKNVLIPFGETIPFGDWFPFYRRALKAWIPQISEFEPGREFTVFPISPEVRLAPMICFDVAQQQVARGMAAAGANLGVVQANLAWFGRTSVAEQFGQYVRFRALENRMPILFLSQNGKSMLFDARGEVAAGPTGQFTTEALALRVRVPRTYSFYTAHGDAVHGAFAAVLALVLGWGYWRRRRGQHAP